MVARSDGDHYGQIRAYRFPKQTVVYGPRQVAAQINQDQVISPQVTLWNQQGSTVTFGTLLVIPIEESLLYVRPLYLGSSTKRIPELKRVIVAYGNQIVMAETLTKALIEIFGTSIASALESDRLESTATSIVEATSAMPGVEAAPALGVNLTFAQLAVELSAAIERQDKALKEGDWAAFGEEQKKIHEIAARMKTIK